jgi:hypothetical protein
MLPCTAVALVLQGVMRTDMVLRVHFDSVDILLALLIDRAMDMQATIGCGKASLRKTGSSLCSMSMA